MDIKSIKPVRKVRTEVGIELPYRIEHGKWNFKVDPAVREVTKVDEGTVFISWSLIEELSGVTTDSLGMGGSLIIGHREGYALEQAGFAVQETRGGYHGTEATKELEAHLAKTYTEAVDPLRAEAVEELISKHSYSAQAIRSWFDRLLR